MQNPRANFALVAIVLLVGALSLGWVFFYDLIEPHNTDRAIPSAHFVRYKLMPIENDSTKILVANLRGRALPDGLVDLTFTLQNNGHKNSHPSLRVIFQDGSGRPMRTVEYGPDDYSHLGEFTTESVTLIAKIQAGEVGFSIEPFYRKGGGK